MNDSSYTEEDVRLVGDGIGDRGIARTALGILARAGRLRPAVDGAPLHAELDRLRAEVASLNAELVEGPLPVLLGWEVAPFNEECGWCPNGIAEGGRVAILSTLHRICESCASGQRRGAK